MRAFRQYKLWRDKLKGVMEQKHGSKIHTRHLDDQEFDTELRNKLIEEVQEVVGAQSKDELITELADLYEVIDTLATLHQVSKEDILSAQASKRNERGGFIRRCFVEVAEHPTGSFGEQYCLADPEKYPEITDR